MNLLKNRKPDYSHHRINVREFERMLKSWFKEDKGLIVEFDTSWEGPDDEGYLGDYYFGFDVENIDENTIDKLSKLYGEDLESVDLSNVLKEVYGKKVETDFNPDKEQLHIYISC